MSTHLSSGARGPRHPVRRPASPAVHSNELDPLAGRRRTERESARHSEMQPDSLERHDASNRATGDGHSPSTIFSSFLMISASRRTAALARSDCLCGRAGYPDQVSPAGTSPKTPACPASLAPSPTVICPPSPACPAITTPLPMRAEPAMPACAMIRHRRPMRTLWPI